MFAQAFAALQAMTGSVAQTGPAESGHGVSFPGGALPLPGAALAAHVGSANSAVPAFDFQAIPGMDILSDAVDYWVDSTQRWILFWDCLRTSGNAYRWFEAETADSEPVGAGAAAVDPNGWTVDGIRIRTLHPNDDVRLDPDKRPVVVFDPRAGTDAGEGDINAAVREALYAGHFVYHATLDANRRESDPAPGDLEAAEDAVLADIARRHPHAGQPPCRIGRCADARLLSALSLLTAETVGAELIDAVPSSFACGLEPASPFRDAGSLLGGQWLASLDRDLGAGRQDGIAKVSALLLREAADRLWAEPYALYAAIDTDDQAYLERAARRDRLFRRRADASRFHVGGAGLAGDPEKPGTLLLDDGRSIDLRAEDKPLLLYAAECGDKGAADLVADAVRLAFGSVEAVRQAGRIVVYAHDKATGQLAFLIAPQAAMKTGARGPVGVGPGLYELVARAVRHPDALGTPIRSDIETALVPRSFRDTAVFRRSAPVPQPALRRAAAVSESLDWHYKINVRPWTRLWPTPGLSKALRALHPMRAVRDVLSDANPGMTGIKALAAIIREDRRPAARDNEFVVIERSFAQRVRTVIATFCTLRNEVLRTTFRLVFENPFWPLLGR